jgi:hypothetical protein
VAGESDREWVAPLDESGRLKTFQFRRTLAATSHTL